MDFLWNLEFAEFARFVHTAIDGAVFASGFR